MPVWEEKTERVKCIVCGGTPAFPTITMRNPWTCLTCRNRKDLEAEEIDYGNIKHFTEAQDDKAETLPTSPTDKRETPSNPPTDKREIPLHAPSGEVMGTETFVKPKPEPLDPYDHDELPRATQWVVNALAAFSGIVFLTTESFAYIPLAITSLVWAWFARHVKTYRKEVWSLYVFIVAILCTMLTWIIYLGVVAWNLLHPVAPSAS